MSSQQIFYLCSCDEWKTKSSMSVIFIGTSARKLKALVKKEILEGNMEYGDQNDSRQNQAKNFAEDFDFHETRGRINDKLLYGYYDYTYNNQEMNGL